MSEKLHRGEKPADAAAWRRWSRGIPAITALLLLAAGIGVVLLEPISGDKVGVLVAEQERAVSDEWFSKLFRKFFPEYYKARDRSKVADDLTALGIEAVPEIIAATRHRLPSVRDAAATALGRIGDRRAVTPLTDLLSRESEWDVRIAAAYSLGQLGDPAATARLIEAMADHQPYVREAAAKALGECGDTAATVVLLRALDDEDYLVRAAAARAIGKIGGRQ